MVPHQGDAKYHKVHQILHRIQSTISVCPWNKPDNPKKKIIQKERIILSYKFLLWFSDTDRENSQLLLETI